MAALTPTAVQFGLRPRHDSPFVDPSDLEKPGTVAGAFFIGGASSGKYVHGEHFTAPVRRTCACAECPFGSYSASP